ncbi:MAG: tRNA (adenosine(37)-N6)-threonylcarbamoyltransferase complex ATPase subunit type 1 TsaE [candidate division KSB1 bacterium]|jgi:tRNA threonylcarbamoyladenosine biosynthesis protein TsaE|nr:tRNA (adenosine(37)-N6)-threonylcarbamoyltransferase complex ATPase subunit type 1 TsaE [candidate division KSB1 bacterium]
MELRTLTHRESETRTIGKRMAALLEKGDNIAFIGELGSGKTCFIKGICEGLGVEDYVTSPTFTLINEYRGVFPVYHFDFYRIKSEEEIFGLGYEEYFYGDGICLIEWADRITAFLNQNRIEIHMKDMFETMDENTREITLMPVGEQMIHRPWSELSL